MTGSAVVHIFERMGLAMAGGSCGLFVFSCIAKLDAGAYSYPAVMIATMAIGGLGFYLGIDLPPLQDMRADSGVSPVHWMSALGTLLTGIAALTAVAVIIREITGNSDTRVLYSLAACWFAGAALQICAGVRALILSARSRPIPGPAGLPGKKP